MRAIVIPEVGGPEVLSLREVPEPRPGPRQVSIRVAYASVNYIDVMARQRAYRVKQFPYVPGEEVAGYIHELGEEVEGLHIGQRVSAFVDGGAYAEFAVADANVTIPLDNEHGQLDLATAAAFPVAATTAYDLLVHVAHLREGETVLIHAASGGVGSIAGQLARALGAGRVLGTVGSEEKIAAARSFGYDQVFLRAGFAEAARNATAGRGVDVILDAAGEPTRSQSLSLLAPLGRIVVFGNASGNPEVPIVPSSLLRDNRGILGYSFNGLRETQPDHLVASARQAIAFLVAGKIRFDIARTLPLEQAAQAHRLLESNNNIGKLLLQVAD